MCVCRGVCTPCVRVGVFACRVCVVCKGGLHTVRASRSVHTLWNLSGFF